MHEASAQLILMMTLTFFLAGMVKGVTGMGLPTVAMGILGAVIPPVAAASMLIIPSFVTNVWQLYAGPRFADLVLRLWLSPVVGLTTGMVTGGTGVFVIPAVPYLQALGLNKDDLIQALGLSFTISTVALAIGLARGGALHWASIATSGFALAPALMGMWFGQWIRQHIAAATFRRWFLICLVLLGLELTVRPFL
jgi:uncharacterized membrane protein YfcA